MTWRALSGRPYRTVRETLALDAALSGGGRADVDGRAHQILLLLATSYDAV
jgi:hypothetical protein